MSICPHCQAENTSGATVCHACGKPLTTTAAGEGLPLWLQALNPEGQVEDMVVAQAHTPPPTDRDKTSPAAKTLPRTEAAQQANEQDVQVAHGQAAHPAVVQPATAAPETDTVVAETQAAPQKTANETPSFAMPTAPRSGTDTVIATQPTIAARDRLADQRGRPPRLAARIQRTGTQWQSGDRRGSIVDARQQRDDQR